MLVTKLTERQAELNLSNADFARLLGISRPLWTSVKSGQRKVGVQLLRGVARAFPDLNDVLLRFLRDDTPSS